MGGTMVAVAGVLHRHQWGARDSTVCKSSELITSISLGHLLHGCTYNNLFCWCFGLAMRHPPPVEEEPTTA